MTGVAPEPPDRAIARVLAGGLRDTPLDIARDLTALLARATATGVTIVSYPDGDTPLYIVERADGEGQLHTVRHYPDRSQWGYTFDRG